MPFSYAIDHESGIVSVRGWGDVSHDDLREHLAALFSDPSLPVPYKQLIDLTDIEEFDLSSDDARMTAEALAQRPEVRNGKLAFVATQPLTYGMSRVLEAMIWRNFDMKIFSTLAEAEKFLDQ
jgi:hypothetical protein